MTDDVSCTIKKYNFKKRQMIKILTVAPVSNVLHAPPPWGVIIISFLNRTNSYSKTCRRRLF